MTSNEEANPADTTVEVTATSRKISGNVELARWDRPHDEDVTYAPTGGVTFSH